MSDWFFMTGEALDDRDRVTALAYLRGLRPGSTTPEPTAVFTWTAARDRLLGQTWDPAWTAAEEDERRRLRGLAVAAGGEEATLARLSATVDEAAAAHGAAAIAAAREGVADPALGRVAAGAAAEALYLDALATLAGAAPDHPFRARRALFAAGRWPLGVAHDGYLVL